jgi:hypothetical protein
VGFLASGIINNIMSNEPFKTEGLQIRTRQKPIKETVYQSKNYVVDYRVSPKIFLGDDGSLYFQDNQVEVPIKLSELDKAYDNIVLENGELRFYYDDFRKYVTLSQMTSNNVPITKSNSVIFSKRKIYDPGENFTGLDFIASKYLDYAPRLDISDDLFNDSESTKDKFWHAFNNFKLRITNETIFDTLVNNFVDGLRVQGDVDENVCLDEDCTLQNKRFFIDNNKIGFEPQVGDPSGKIYFNGSNLTAFNNYCFSNLFKYNGVGKYLSKVFSPKIATANETFWKWFFVDDGYTTILDADLPSTSNFILDAVNNSSCDGVLGGPISMGSVGLGYVYMRVNNSSLDAGNGVNTLVPYVGCRPDNVIGSIETSLGRVNFNGITTFEVTEDIDDLKIWFNDYDNSDNTGNAYITFIYSPHFVNITGDFTVDATNNVAFGGMVGISGVNGFESDTEKVFVGVFSPGELTITYSSGNIRPDGVSFYNTSISGSPNIGYVNTTLGDISFDTPTVFQITSQTQLEAWYENVDNSNGEGNVTFQFSFVPSNSLLQTPPPIIDGRGIFYGTDFYPYQSVLLSDISKAFSNEVFKRFMIDFNTVLDANGLVVGNYFRQAAEIDTIVDFESMLEQVKVKFINNKALLSASLENVLNQVFAGEEINILNLGDYSGFTIGGKFNVDNIIDIDYSIFNDVWMDIEDFNIVTPKVTNDIGISLMATLNVDIKHRTKTRFEFRLFDSVAQKELDRCIIQTINYEPFGEIGSIQKEYIETYPIQLQYFGPISTIKCEKEIFNKCVSKTDFNIMSHVSINAEDLFSEKQVDDKFSFITNRIKNLQTSARNTNATSSVVVNIETPRIYRVQWRMVVDPTIIDNGHKDTLSDIYFNNIAARGDTFEISLNMYSLGEIDKTKILNQGIVVFKNEHKKLITLSNATNSTYSVSLMCSKNINVWYQDKTTNGFVIVSEKDFDGEVCWIVSKQPEIKFDDQEDKQEIPDCLIDFIPNFSNKSNFQIFKDNGYNINLLQEVIPINDSQVQIDNEKTENVDQPSELEKTYFIDENGPFCSEECINDCPDGWFCSDICPGAYLTKSGCSCCECLQNSDCPEGMICVNGECL